MPPRYHALHRFKNRRMQSIVFTLCRCRLPSLHRRCAGSEEQCSMMEQSMLLKSGVLCDPHGGGGEGGGSKLLVA